MASPPLPKFDKDIMDNIDASKLQLLQQYRDSGITLPDVVQNYLAHTLAETYLSVYKDTVGEVNFEDPKARTAMMEFFAGTGTVNSWARNKVFQTPFDVRNLVQGHENPVSVQLGQARNMQDVQNILLKSVVPGVAEQAIQSMNVHGRDPMDTISNATLGVVRSIPGYGGAGSFENYALYGAMGGGKSGNIERAMRGAVSIDYGDIDIGSTGYTPEVQMTAPGQLTFSNLYTKGGFIGNIAGGRPNPIIDASDPRVKKIPAGYQQLTLSSYDLSHVQTTWEKMTEMRSRGGGLVSSQAQRAVFSIYDQFRSYQSEMSAGQRVEYTSVLPDMQGPEDISYVGDSGSFGEEYNSEIASRGGGGVFAWQNEGYESPRSYRYMQLRGAYAGRARRAMEERGYAYPWEAGVEFEQSEKRFRNISLRNRPWSNVASSYISRTGREGYRVDLPTISQPLAKRAYGSVTMAKIRTDQELEDPNLDYLDDDERDFSDPLPRTQGGMERARAEYQRQMGLALGAGGPEGQRVKMRRIFGGGRISGPRKLPAPPSAEEDEAYYASLGLSSTPPGGGGGEGPPPWDDAWDSPEEEDPEGFQTSETPQARMSMESSPLPRNALSEEAAFRNNPEGIGVAKARGASYIRAPKGGWVEQEAFYSRYTDPVSQGRNVQRMRLGAAAHETGHHFYSYLSGKDRSQWEEMYYKTDPKSRLTGSPAEEFSQSYAVSAVGGTSLLEKINPEYAGFVRRYEAGIRRFEQRTAPPVVEFRDKQARAYRLQRSEDLGYIGSDDDVREPPGAADIPLPSDDIEDDQTSWLGGNPRARAQSRSSEEQANAFREAAEAHDRARRNAPHQMASNFERAQATLGAVLQSVRTPEIAPKAPTQWGAENLIKDPSGETVGISYIKEGGEIGMSSGDLERSLGMAKTAVGTAFNMGGLENLSGRDMLATVKTRANDLIKRHIDQLFKEAEQQPTQELQGQARDITTKISTAVKKYSDILVDKLGNTVMEDDGSLVGGSYKDVAYNANRLWNTDQIAAAQAANPQLLQYGTPSQMASGPLMSVTAGDNAYTFGNAGGPPGGPGGPGGGRGGRFQNMWSGSLGRMLYGAYVAKRLWSWTGADVMRDIPFFGEEMASMIPMTGGDLTSSDEGFMMRQSATRSYFARGAYEQFGGLMDFPYALTGFGDALPRATAGLKFGAGLAAGGYALAATMPLFQTGGALAGVAGAGAMAGIGSVAAPLAIGIGAAALLGTAGMEAYNYLNPDQTPMTWGGTWRNLVSDFWIGNARDKISTSRYQEAVAAGDRPRRGQIRVTDEEAIESLTPQQQAYIEGGRGFGEDLQRMMDLSNVVREKTGEDIKTVQPGIRSIFRRLGKLDEELIGSFASGLREQGLSWGEGVSMAEQIGSSLGLSGEGYAGILTALSGPERGGLDLEGQRTLQRAAGQFARYGGMFGSYYSDPNMATQLAMQYGVMTQGAAQPIQQLLAAVSPVGIDGETPITYAFTGEYESRRPVPITAGDVAAQMTARVGRQRAGYAAQVAAMFAQAGVDPTSILPFAEQVGAATAGDVSSISTLLGTAQQFGQGYGGQAFNLAQTAMGFNPYQAGVIAQRIMPAMARAGMDMGGIYGLSGMSNQDIFMAGQIVGGDMGAASYRSRELGIPDYQFQNMFGQPIYKTEGSTFFGMMQAQAGMGNVGAQRFWDRLGISPATGVAGQIAAARQIWGGVGEGYASTFLESGALGTQMLYNANMASYQMAGIGLQQQGLTLQMNYLWGNDEGGTWDSPTAGSAWGLQDRQRRMGYRSQMADFRATQERMELGNQFAQQQEGISFSRMQANQNWQRWSRGFDWAGMQLSRQWQREDWSYSDQMRGLNWGWQMEDMDEAIRFSSGRERQRMVRQRDRASLTHNLEEENIDNKRKRQEELWAREDERFEQSQEYAEELMDLDRQQFELTREQRETMFNFESEQLQRHISEYQAQFELQGKIIEKDREYQYEQIMLQQRMLGVQAAAAAETKKYSEAMLEVTTGYEETAGYWKTMMEYNPEQAFKILADLGYNVSLINPNTAVAVKDMTYHLRIMSPLKPDAITRLINSINNVSSAKISSISRLLAQLAGRP